MPLSLDGLTEPVARLLSESVGSLLPLSRIGMTPSPQLGPLANVPATKLFPEARRPAAALSGLFLRLGDWEKCHQLSQDIDSQEGSYWHAIVHRIEPDSGNSRYWFRQVGRHAIFPELESRAAQILGRFDGLDWQLPAAWEPALFITLCDRARQESNNSLERLAVEIQDAEWELLFRWCASA